MTMTSQTGSLVILDAHKTGQEKVLWQGVHLDKVVKVKVDNGKVCLHVRAVDVTPVYAELTAANIKIKLV